MKHFALLAAVIVVFATSATAQRKDTSHASREAAIHLLQREGIISGKTRVVSAEWSADARWWLITLRDTSGTLSTWTVDSAAPELSVRMQALSAFHLGGLTNR